MSRGRQDTATTHNTVNAIILYTIIHTRKEEYLPGREAAAEKRKVT